MFGRKRMSEEEIKQGLAELENLSGDVGFAKARELEKYAPAEAAYYLGLYYFNGDGVEQNLQLALQYMETYVRRHPKEQGLAWFVGGMVHYVNDDYTEAIEWYGNAIKLGIDWAKTSYALCAYLLAAQMRGLSGRTLKVNEYNMANQACIKWYIQCCNMYSEAIQEKAAELDDTDWCVFAKSADMLLAMAYQGTMVDLKTAGNGIGSWVSASFRAMDAKVNKEQNEVWKAYAYMVSQKMEEEGKELFAETLRLFTCLNECRYEHKAESFYRAQWHRGYVFELMNHATEDEKAAWNNNFPNLSGEYGDMERKYDRIATGYMLDGRLPDLTPDYPEGQAKDPETCKSFMNRFHVERNMQVMKNEEKNNAPKKGKGLFGLFKK